jgi:hypothetical protein
MLENDEAIADGTSLAVGDASGTVSRAYCVSLTALNFTATRMTEPPDSETMRTAIRCHWVNPNLELSTLRGVKSAGEASGGGARLCNPMSFISSQRCESPPLFLAHPEPAEGMHTSAGWRLCFHAKEADTSATSEVGFAIHPAF